MSDRFPDDTDDSNDDRADDGDRWENGPPDESGEGRSWLSSLLTALDRLDEFSASSSSPGSRPRPGSRPDTDSGSESDPSRREGRSSFDYDISIRTGLDDLFDGGNAGDRDRDVRRSELNQSPDRSSDRRRTRRRNAANADHRVTTRTGDDELLVTADLSGVDPDDITVGFDEGTLVVGVDNRELERVAVPWPEPSSEAVVRNGILSVTVTPDSGSSSDAGSIDVESESESESETETESETTDETEDTDTDTNTDTDENTEDDT